MRLEVGDIEGGAGSTLVTDSSGKRLPIKLSEVGSVTLPVTDSQVIADNAAFTDGTSKVFTAGYIYDDVAGTALTENDAAAARIDSKRAQVGVIEDRTTRGRYAGVSAANQLQVSVDATQGVAIDTNGGNKANGTFRVTLATDQTTLTNPLGTTLGSFKTCTTDVTRPADTTAYTANDALSNSTSAPTAGGFTFTDAARISGGSGIITDAIITTSADAGTLLQGEIWVFDQAVTNINDNAAFAVSDTEIKTCVGKIPFTLEDAGNNGFYHATNLNIGFTCVGSANLRFLVRVKNAYTPASAEVLTFVVKVLRVD